MLVSAKPKACWCLLAAMLAACLSCSPLALPLASARAVSSLHGDHQAELTLSAASHGSIILTSLDSQAASMVTSSTARRQLTGIPVIGVLSYLAESLLGEFIGRGTGAIADAILGGDTVPVNLAQLIEDALQEIDRIVGDKIAEAFRSEKRQLLSSLGQRVREYTRRNNLEVTRDIVQDMLDDASDLLAFFHGNAVITNNAYQVTLSLRLSLQLELLHLDQLIGESASTLDSVRNSIRAQARDGEAALKHWAATYRPTKDTTRSSRSYITKGCSSPGCNRKKYHKGSIRVCMVLESPDLEKPDEYCREKRAACESNHIFEHIRKQRIDRCLDKLQDKYKKDIKKHAESIGIAQFRERNEATVFGEDFRDFLALLGDVENMEFADVSLPGDSA